MQLEWIIAALRTRCPSFANRFAGAAEYRNLPESVSLATPYGFVIPLDDSPGESRSSNSVRQPLTDSFAVVVVVSNAADERGQSAVASIHTLRAELWAALLGWRPVAPGGDTSQSRYEGIVYQGGQVVGLDRARLHYQFEFGADMEITPADGWQGIELAALPPFEGANINIDAIDPMADPNVQYPGPDDRIEAVLRIPKTGALPT